MAEKMDDNVRKEVDKVMKDIETDPEFKKKVKSYKVKGFYTNDEEYVSVGDDTADSDIVTSIDYNNVVATVHYKSGKVSIYQNHYVTQIDLEPIEDADS